jgi:hypothetical protein
MFCIVHYSDKNNYSEVIEVGEVNEQKIRLAKEKREELGGENYHQEQCDSVPVCIDNNIHGIHLDPCYKKFTRLLSTYTSLDNLPQKKSTRQTLGTDAINLLSAWVFPSECYFCKKVRVQYKGNDLF